MGVAVASKVVFLLANTVLATTLYTHPDKAVPINRPGLVLVVIGDAALLALTGFFSF